MKVHFIDKLLIFKLIFFLFCNRKLFSNLNSLVCRRKLESLSNHIALMNNKHFSNLIFYANRENFTVIYIHTIFREETTLMFLFTICTISIFINSNITNNIYIVLMELFDSIILSCPLHKRTLTIGHKLNVIVDIKPLILISLIKIYAITYLYGAAYKVFGFYVNEIAYFVILMAQEASMNHIIGSFRSTSAELKLFKSLVIVEHYSLRTANNFTRTILRNNIYCITSPNINTNDSIKFVIKSNGARLSITSSTRNICLCFKISKSISCAIRNTKSKIIHEIASCIFYSSFNSLFRKLLIISKSFFIAGVHKFALTTT